MSAGSIWIQCQRSTHNMECIPESVLCLDTKRNFRTHLQEFLVHPQAGWPKRLALLRATPRASADFDVIGVRLR